MTLSTNLYVLDQVDVRELFHFGQALLAKYDDRVPPVRAEDQRWEEKESWRGQGAWSVRNEIMQGLPAILDIGYRPDAPLTTVEQSEQCTEDCDPTGDDEPYHYHPHACWADVDFDTAYGYKDSRGWGCGDLHAVLVAEMGNWLDERGVRWEWRNEFTGEVHGGDARYEKLIELVSGGFEANAWFRTSVIPAIAAHVAGAES